MKISIRRPLLALTTGLALCGLATPVLAQQALPQNLEEGAKSDVPVAVQVLRWHMLDADVNTLTFRSMDELFTTREVPRSGPVWNLPREDHALDFTYQYGGKTYAADDFAERTYTNALLVMKDGNIVSETYRNNSGPQSRFMGWSMTKSLTSILVGCALAEGRIRSLDDPITAYLPELKGGGYDGVTIRQVMQMRSGVDYEERYDFANPGIAATNHINALVKNVARFADAARTVGRAHEPGTVTQYKTIDTAVLGWLIERVSGGSTIAAYMAQRLWEPLGAERDGFFIMDGAPGTGREFNGAGFNATLRDYARVGAMMLNGGMANGHQIVSPEWVAASTRPVEPEKPGELGYGMQWWTLGDGSYSAIGLQGQYIFVDPKSRTVVVKLSYFPPGNQTADDETVAFLKAAAAWQPQ
ncbi:serine hydrolase domain-containing protein [Croceicoccus sediminis]|uniref:serine hydrolase domain-containing protein n=1 Tax=Croceicoccus sediminis TaxID=2571150 RepID=UPI001181F704|nr:serine hydrolase [Croceicoccus sediminis]